MDNSSLGVIGVILANLGIGIGLICSGWATRPNAGEKTQKRVPWVMMIAGFIFLGISLFLLCKLKGVL